MPYYEIIYEDGTHSIATYDDDTVMLQAVGEAHRRAKMAEPINATNLQVGRRVVKVEKYDAHPGSYGESGLMPADQVKSEVDALVKALNDNGMVDVKALAAQVQHVVSPQIDTPPHDSSYKLASTKTYTEGWE